MRILLYYSHMNPDNQQPKKPRSPFIGSLLHTKKLPLSEASSSLFRAAHIISAIIGIVTLVALVLPIVLTFIATKDAGASGGAVVFAMFFIAPFIAMIVAGLLLAIPLILMLIGAIRLQWHIHPVERNLMIRYAIISVIAILLTIRFLPELLPTYLPLL